MAPTEPRVRLVRYRAGGDTSASRVGLLREDGVVDLLDEWAAAAETPAPWAGGDDDVLVATLAAGEAIADALRSFTSAPRTAVNPLEAVRLLAPVAPRTIVATGWNFAVHVEEAKEAMRAQPPDMPTGFLKLPSGIVGPEDEIVHPERENRLDYEVELAAVICRPVHMPSAEQAEEAIGGYTLMNDVSARDVQTAEMHAGLLVAGKNFPTFAPFGPAVVPRWDFDYGAARVRMRVNGVQRQDELVASASHSLPELVAYWSGVFPLAPGDVVTLGSPPGVAMGGTEEYLRPGDVTEAEEAQIGVLRNHVVAPRPVAGWTTKAAAGTAIERPARPRIGGLEGGDPTSARLLNSHPALQAAHLGLFDRLFHNGLLSPRDREILVLRTGWNCRSVYEFGRHAEIASTQGVDEEEILALTRPPDAHPWPPHERTLITVVDELCADSCVSEAAWNALRGIYDDARLVEALYVVGFWAGWAGILNATGAMTEAYRKSWADVTGGGAP